MDVIPIIDALEKNSAASVRVNPDDYVSEDGLLMCGKCHTPKQCRLEILGKIRTPYCLCKCESERVNAERAAERHRNRCAELRDKAFDYPAMQDCRFENDNGANPAFTNVCRNYVTNFPRFREDGKGLLLYGDVGRGKTYMAACIANALIDNEIRCRMTGFSVIANDLFSMRDGRQEYIEWLSRFPLLILDDLNSERNTDYMNELVFSVIDARCKANMPIIVTTNLSGAEMGRIRESGSREDMQKRRVISRLYESCIPYEVIGEDQRRKQLQSDFGEYKKLLGI